MSAAVLGSPAVRYLAVIVGTALWDAGAVLQKKAVDRLPSGGLRVRDLLGSGRWLAGLGVTAAGWAAYVFAVEAIPVSAARTVSGGSYALLAVSSAVFLRAPLSRIEWLAVGVVTAGVVLLGLEERGAAAASAAIASPLRAAAGVAVVLAVSAALLLLSGPARANRKRLLKPLAAFAALSGLLSSVGDLMLKLVLSQVGAAGPVTARLAPLAAAGAGLVVFYLGGFYMLSRAYQVGSVVAGVVISDFTARIGAIVLGAVILSEPLVGPGSAGLLRLAGFLAVLAGSLALGRFGDARRGASPAGASRQ
jgi:multidrug transporter EmrE-like cation transporter